MNIIDLKLDDLRAFYKKQEPIIIEGVKYHIGLINGAHKEFRLYCKGKQYTVYSDYQKDDCTFIIL